MYLELHKNILNYLILNIFLVCFLFTHIFNNIYVYYYEIISKIIKDIYFKKAKKYLLSFIKKNPKQLKK
jgi:hypothetical protein